MSLPTNFFIGRMGRSWGYNFSNFLLVSYNQSSSWGTFQSYLDYFTSENINNYVGVNDQWMTDDRYLYQDPVSNTGFVWAVPEDGNYEFQVAGAAGSSVNDTQNNIQRTGGDGAVLTARFTLQKKQLLRFIVGKNRSDHVATYYVGGHGGGASAVMTYSEDVGSRVPLIVAGGGGGAASSYVAASWDGRNAYIDTRSTTGQSDFAHAVTGGAQYHGNTSNTTAGYGGYQSYSSGYPQTRTPGAGFYGDSQLQDASTPAESLQSTATGRGGFGGGGNGTGLIGGAGGGYTGGGSVSRDGSAYTAGVGTGGSSWWNGNYNGFVQVSASVGNYHGANNFGSAGQSGWIRVTKL